MAVSTSSSMVVITLAASRALESSLADRGIVITKWTWSGRSARATRAGGWLSSRDRLSTSRSVTATKYPSGSGWYRNSHGRSESHVSSGASTSMCSITRRSRPAVSAFARVRSSSRPTSPGKARRYSCSPIALNVSGTGRVS